MAVQKEKKEKLGEALLGIEKENGIDGEILIEKIKTGLIRAARKQYKEFSGCADEDFKIEINREKNKITMVVIKHVVETPEAPNEISLEDAKKLEEAKQLKGKGAVKIGGKIEIKLSPASFGRGAAGAAKQSLRNDIRDYENAQLVEQFKDKVGECITAKVVRIDAVSGIATLQVEKNEILLFKSEQIPGEIIREGQFVKVYVMEIKNSDKKPTVKVSRKHHGLVKRLFELEVPEIHDGTVEIKSISREAGVRTKIAVLSNDENVDAKGACIGPRRSRITKIIEELEGEKIDIIQYSENDEEFIAAALSPAQVISVTINDPEPDEKTGELKNKCTVIVPNNQLSLAIGNRGQNAKLAAKLTKYTIDIKPENEIPE